MISLVLVCFVVASSVVPPLFVDNIEKSKEIWI
nr:MAG TPA: hypothetical protein [Caudoviricetes sp.]